MMRIMRSQLQPRGSAPVGAGRGSRCTSTSSSRSQRCSSSRLRGTCRTLAHTAVCQVSPWHQIVCKQALRKRVQALSKAAHQDPFPWPQSANLEPPQQPLCPAIQAAMQGT